MEIKIDVLIPTYKPDKGFMELVKRLQEQTIRVNKIIVMNTEEQYFNQVVYGSDFLKRNSNLEVHHISKREFNHGKTRNEMVKRSEADIFIFMTMDALPADSHMLEELIRPLIDQKTAVSYARQLPPEGSSLAERFTRGYNYPGEDRVKFEKDREELGIKTYFCSNVCAAYKRYIFDELGGFVKYTIFNEDMIFAAGAAKAGYGIAYAAGARVFHGHNYSNRQQFLRNFDLAVSQEDHPEVFSGISSEKEGRAYLKKAGAFFRDHKKPWLILPFTLSCACRYAGYRMGRRYKKLPRSLILKFTMDPSYWERFWERTDVPENVYAGYGKGENEG